MEDGKGTGKRLVDVSHVMRRCGVGRTKAREIMDAVGLVRLGFGKNCAKRVEEALLEAYILRQQSAPACDAPDYRPTRSSARAARRERGAASAANGSSASSPRAKELLAELRGGSTTPPGPTG